MMISTIAIASLLLAPAAALMFRGEANVSLVADERHVPTSTWAHQRQKGACWSKIYRFSNARGKSLTQFGLDFQQQFRLPGAGIGEIVPFQSVLKDGFLPLDCIKDEMYYHGDKYDDNRHDYTMKDSNVSIVHYSAVVDKVERKSMTPEECFDFCRTVPKMLYFGILNGRQCYCEPYFKRMAGSSESCSSPCEGDPTRMCGGKSKSQIFEMHMCADTAGDLKDGVAKLQEISKTVGKKALAIKKMAEQATKESEEFQTLFRKLSDATALDLIKQSMDQATDLLRVSQRAGKFMKKVTDAEDDTKKLLDGSFLQQQGYAPDFSDFKTVKAAEKQLETVESIADASKSVDKELDKALHLNSKVRDASEIGNRTQNYYDAYYFGNYEDTSKNIMGVHNWGKDKSVCDGELLSKPLFGLSENDCAYECDSTKGCVGFNYLAKGRGICMLFSKVEQVSHYDMCGKGLEGKCAPSPVKGAASFLSAAQSDKATSVPFEWKTKTEKANATLFKESVNGLCTNVYGCSGCGAEDTISDCSLMEHYECNRFTRTSLKESGGVISIAFAGWLQRGRRANACSVNKDPCPGCKKYSTCSGPWLETKPMEIKKGDVASYTWRSSGKTDNYEVFVGLYSEECGLVDYQFQRGDKQTYRTFELYAPKTDKYYVKFLLASYDGTGGGAVGADMQVKDVKQTKATIPKVFDTEAKCALKMSEFVNLDLKPDPTGQCKQCFTRVNKRCLKPDGTFPLPPKKE